MDGDTREKGVFNLTNKGYPKASQGKKRVRGRKLESIRGKKQKWRREEKETNAT